MDTTIDCEVRQNHVKYPHRLPGLTVIAMLTNVYGAAVGRGGNARTVYLKDKQRSTWTHMSVNV
jgi:hypothetical protein